MQMLVIPSSGGGPGGGGGGCEPGGNLKSNEYSGGCGTKPDPILVKIITRFNREQNPPKVFLEYTGLQGASDKLAKAAWEKAKRLRGLPFSLAAVRAMLAAEKTNNENLFVVSKKKVVEPEPVLPKPKAKPSVKTTKAKPALAKAKPKTKTRAKVR